jgi:hypothetical protein
VRALALVPLALFAGCIALREGRYDCADGRCPSDWYCHASTQRCFSTPEAPADGGAFDAPRDAPVSVDDAPVETDAPTSIDAPGGDRRDAGECVGRANLSACSVGICCGEACVNSANHPEHCGTCGTRCDDGIDCTVDYCMAGSCMRFEDSTRCPPDMNPCNVEACSVAIGCYQIAMFDGDPCGPEAVCCDGDCTDLVGACGGGMASCSSISSFCVREACRAEGYCVPP